MLVELTEKEIRIIKKALRFSASEIYFSDHDLQYKWKKDCWTIYRNISDGSNLNKQIKW